MRVLLICCLVIVVDPTWCCVWFGFLRVRLVALVVYILMVVVCGCVLLFAVLGVSQCCGVGWYFGVMLDLLFGLNLGCWCWFVNLCVLTVCFTWLV